VTAAEPEEAEWTAFAAPIGVAVAAAVSAVAAAAVAAPYCYMSTTRHCGTWAYMAYSRSTGDAGQWPSGDCPLWWVAMFLLPASPEAIAACKWAAEAVECMRSWPQTVWKVRVWAN